MWTTNTYDDAEKRGYEDGKAAGSWVVDGNTTSETAAKIVQGLMDGDPEIMDLIPSAPLSGEWADGLLPRDVLDWYGLTEDADEADDVLTAYELGYSAGAVHEVERSARAAIDTDEL
jgi:hypothetical protein